MTPRPDSIPFPLDTLLLPNDMVHHHQAYARRHMPLVPTMEIGVVVRVEVTRR